MIDALQGLGYGIIALAVLIGIGVVILGQLGATVSGCAAGFGYQTNGTKTYTTGLCCNSTTWDCVGKNSTNPHPATTVVNTLSNTGGLGVLSQWIPVIIVLVIGMIFLGAFMARKSKQN